MYEVYEDHLFPLSHLFYDGVTHSELFPSFYLPLFMEYIVGFFVIFEFTCNVYADLSGLADR